MKRIPARAATLAALLVLATTSCRKEDGAPAAPGAPAKATSAAKPAAPTSALKDVVDNGPGYIVGISYPPGVAKYPGLADALVRYATAARTELMAAVEPRKLAPGDAPYELALNFAMLSETPQLVAVGVDGSRYLGGAHSEPMIARFVWLPPQNRMLTADDLLADAKQWPAVAALVREQLATAAAQRAEADDIAPADRAELLKNAKQMIEEGTAKGASQFANFEPVMSPAGRITALRFVFPPYQVGAYADGTQTVDVPAAALLPYVAPQYRSLFEDAAP